MSELRRLVMVRHGETVGNSRERFHGRGDVALSEEGRAQMRALATALRGEYFDLVVASPLCRSWEGAWLVGRGASVRLEPDFREIDFGRWEGLTREEIEAQDPILYQDWQDRTPGFDFPSGERRADFSARVLAGLGRLHGSGASSALLVVHKGVVRTIAEELLGAPLAHDEPRLGACVQLSRASSGDWLAGRRSSDPPGLS